MPADVLPTLLAYTAVGAAQAGTAGVVKVVRTVPATAPVQLPARVMA